MHSLDSVLISGPLHDQSNMLTQPTQLANSLKPGSRSRGKSKSAGINPNDMALVGVSAIATHWQDLRPPYNWVSICRLRDSPIT